MGKDQIASSGKVKIQIVRASLIGEVIHEPGQIVEVSEAVATELCDKTFQGYHPFYGHMPEIGPLLEANPLQRKQIVKAVRVA